MMIEEKTQMERDCRHELQEERMGMYSTPSHDRGREAYGSLGPSLCQGLCLARHIHWDTCEHHGEFEGVHYVLKGRPGNG